MSIFEGLGVGVRGYGLGVRGQGLGLCVLVFGGEASEHGPIIVLVMAWVRQNGGFSFINSGISNQDL